MASDEIPVGSKWRHREFGHERTVKALVSEPPTPDAIANYGRVPCVLWTEGNGPAPFDRVSTVLGKFTRIDQSKAEDPVPVGSAWQRNGRTWKLRVTSVNGENVDAEDVDNPDAGWHMPRALLRSAWTRIDTLSPPITDPFERAVVGALSRMPQKCAPTCGPAAPCKTTLACIERDGRERRAWLGTPADSGHKRTYQPAAQPPRFAPPAPSPVGLGSLVGQYRVSVERKRVR